MEGRTDLPQYQNAAAELTNFKPELRGGLIISPGLKFIQPTFDSSVKSHLYTFEFNTEQAYIIEAGNLYFRFYTENGRVHKTSVAVSNAVNNGSGAIRLTATGHGLSTGQYAFVDGIVGTTEANGDWQVTVVDANTVDLNNSVFTNAYVSGGTIAQIVHLTTPYTSSEVASLDFAQTNDVAYIAHPNHPVQKLTRTSPTTFTLTEVVFAYPPFKDINTTSIALTPTATTGNITITSNASLFTPQHVNSFWRINNRVNNKIGYVKITAFQSSLQVSATVINPLLDISATTVWAEGAFSDDEGYPTATVFFEGRLLFGKDQTIYGSAIDDFENFGYILDGETDITDEAAYSYTINSNKQNLILWMRGLGFLFVGTGGGTVKIAGGNNKGITPTEPPIIQPQTTEGCADILPIITGGDIIFVDRTTKRLIALEFILNKDQYVGTDVTLFNHEILGSGLTQLSIEEAPDPFLWAVSSNGHLVMGSILRAQQVIAFAKRTTDGTFESVASIPDDTNKRTLTAVIVKRTINGATKRYVEFSDPSIAVDSGLTATFGSPVTTVTGFKHLEGKTISIIGDNAVYPNQVVTNGTITLNPSATTVTGGLPYTPTATLFKPEIQTPQGFIQGRPYTIDYAIFRVRSVTGLSVNNTQIPSRSTADLLGSAPQPISRDIRASIRGVNTPISFSLYLPLPNQKILSVYEHVTIGDN